MLAPCGVDGTTLTIRKFGKRYSLLELVGSGSLPPMIASILTDAVFDRRNILISGGTGTGKTTLLNALAESIPDIDRIVLIEETSEIQINKPNLVRFEARRKQTKMGTEEPMPAVTIAELLRATLRHRPDRIILGEVRGAEAWDLLQALNTGHQGSMTTIHGNSAWQALTRLAHCTLMADVGLPLPAVKEAIALAIGTVVHIARVHGQRRVTEVLAITEYDTQTDRISAEMVYQA